MNAHSQPSSDDLRLVQIIWDYMFLTHQLPERADIIIGLGSHDISVVDDVAMLYHRSIAPLVLFSGNVGRLTNGVLGRPEASLMRERAVTLGIPNGAILTEERSTNTGENIQFTQSLLHSLGIKPNRVVIVHKPYMLRRDYATFMRQWRNAHQIELTCWADNVACSEYILKQDNPVEEIAVIVGDLQRMKKYYERGFQIEQIVPSDTWSAFESLVERGYDAHLAS